MIKKIIACVLAVLVIAGGITAYALLPHSLSYDIGSIEKTGSALEVVSRTEDTVTVRKTDDGDLKILMFTDMHLDGKNKTSGVTVSHLVDNITSEKPDLVILGGDNVTSAFNRKRSGQLADIFEKLGVYWGGIIGNHEGDNKYSVSRDEMMDIFMSREHCLMAKGPGDVWGCCNYCLNILNKDGTLMKTFYFLDTGDEISGETARQYDIPDDGRTHYDGVKESQVEWYKEKLADNTEEYGESKSVMVVHIPLFQMKEAAEKEEFLYGGKLENVCASCFDSGIFDALKEGGSTDYVFCGHDHLNTFALDVDGIILSYIEPSGYGSYTTASRLGYEEKDWLQGYTKLTVSGDGQLTHEQIRNSAK